MIANSWNVVDLLDSAFVIARLPNRLERLSNTTYFVLRFYGRRCRIFIFQLETAGDFLIFRGEKASNFYFSAWNSRRLFDFPRGEGIEFLFFDVKQPATFWFSEGRRRRIFISRREEAISYLFLGQKKPSILYFSDDFYFSTISQFQLKTAILTSFYPFPCLHQVAYNWAVFALCCSCPAHYGTVTQLYAVHDQDSKTARTFISDCCNRRRSKHAKVSCVVNFVNCLQSVSVAILMENVLILFCGVGGLFYFFSGPAHILCLTVTGGWNKQRCGL
jgi:hypothetical protein